MRVGLKEFQLLLSKDSGDHWCCVKALEAVRAGLVLQPDQSSSGQGKQGSAFSVLAS